jgi:predicted RNA-binding protein YlqC (UPF0109 family)
MDDLLSYLVKEIVEKPDSVDVLVDESQNSNDITLIIDSDPEDVPLIIGKKGKTIKALRNMISILALKDRKRVHLTVKHQKPRDIEFSNEEDSRETVEEVAPVVKKAPVRKPKAVKKEKSISQEETEDVLGF